jgi:hypothetical protein
VVDGVQHVVAAQGGPVRAAPQHVRGELPVEDVGVGEVMALPESRDKAVDRLGCLSSARGVIENGTLLFRRHMSNAKTST